MQFHHNLAHKIEPYNVTGQIVTMNLAFRTAIYGGTKLGTAIRRSSERRPIEGPPEDRRISHQYETDGFKGGPKFGPHYKYQSLRHPMKFFLRYHT